MLDMAGTTMGVGDEVVALWDQALHLATVVEFLGPHTCVLRIPGLLISQADENIYRLSQTGDSLVMRETPIGLGEPVGFDIRGTEIFVGSFVLVALPDQQVMAATITTGFNRPASAVYSLPLSVEHLHTVKEV